jgi:Cu2+-exporting ATPase
MQKPNSNCPIQEELSKVGSYLIKAYNPNDLHLPVEQVVEHQKCCWKIYCPMFAKAKSL